MNHWQNAPFPKNYGSEGLTEHIAGLMRAVCDAVKWVHAGDFAGAEASHHYAMLRARWLNEHPASATQESWPALDRTSKIASDISAVLNDYVLCSEALEKIAMALDAGPASAPAITMKLTRLLAEHVKTEEALVAERAAHAAARAESDKFRATLVEVGQITKATGCDCGPLLTHLKLQAEEREGDGRAYRGLKEEVRAMRPVVEAAEKRLRERNLLKGSEGANWEGKYDAYQQAGEELETATEAYIAQWANALAGDLVAAGEVETKALSSSRPVTDAVPCRACGKPLLPENTTSMADGCPCNSARGVNHGLVPKLTCTCVECDPAQTGSVRQPEPRESDREGPRVAEVDVSGKLEITTSNTGITMECTDAASHTQRLYVATDALSQLLFWSTPCPLAAALAEVERLKGALAASHGVIRSLELERAALSQREAPEDAWRTGVPGAENSPLEVLVTWRSDRSVGMSHWDGESFQDVGGTYREPSTVLAWQPLPPPFVGKGGEGKGFSTAVGAVADSLPTDDEIVFAVPETKFTPMVRKDAYDAALAEVERLKGALTRANALIGESADEKAKLAEHDTELREGIATLRRRVRNQQRVLSGYEAKKELDAERAALSQREAPEDAWAACWEWHYYGLATKEAQTVFPSCAPYMEPGVRGPTLAPASAAVEPGKRHSWSWDWVARASAALSECERLRAGLARANSLIGESADEKKELSDEVEKLTSLLDEIHDVLWTQENRAKYEDLPRLVTEMRAQVRNAR